MDNDAGVCMLANGVHFHCGASGVLEHGPCIETARRENQRGQGGAVLADQYNAIAWPHAQRLKILCGLTDVQIKISVCPAEMVVCNGRSEEHTSELQSLMRT